MLAQLFLFHAIYTKRTFEETQGIAGAVNMGYDKLNLTPNQDRTYNLFRDEHASVPLGYCDGDSSAGEIVW